MPQFQLGSESGVGLRTVCFVICLAAILAATAMAQAERPELPAGLRTPPWLTGVVPLLDHAEPQPSPPRKAAPLVPSEPLTRELFLDPPARYRPWTRWWWLGDLVDDEEIRREVALFVDAGFGGVELQAFSLGDRFDRREGVRDRILRFDSDDFWGHVRATLDAARSAGLGVDLNHGSGWPAGGPWVGLEDTYETLIYGEASIEGGREVAMALPEPRLPIGYELTLLLEGAFGTEVISFPVEHRRLVAVVAAREVAAQEVAAGYSAEGELVVRDGSETGRFEPLRDRSSTASAAARREPVTLDRSTLRVLDSEIEDGELRWLAPAGVWQVIAIYAMPVGEAPSLVATPHSGLVLDHFDSGKVKAHYDYLFGSRTGIDHYWGDPVRGFFNDSLEFKVERHWARGFLEEFAKRRGYDLRPFLPVLFVTGADNFFVSDIFGVHPEPDFRLARGTVGSGTTGDPNAADGASRGPDDEEGTRVRWDYELTVSELATERFYDTSREWAAARGLQSRAQGYGMALDAIRAAGHIDIPETEALYAGGSDLFLKLATSGAHLYGRPLVSAESFVWRGAEYRTTPQKVRAAADKLFAAGVNQIVWHGTPYRVARAEPSAALAPEMVNTISSLAMLPAERPRTGTGSSPVRYSDGLLGQRSDTPPTEARGDGFGDEGWYPWSLPAATLGFSTNFSEASPFWRDAPEINRYLARSQALLRRGRPEADVLVYYPFLRFPSSFGGDAAVAAREDLFNGWLREAEPEVTSVSIGALLGGRVESREDPLVPWLREQQLLLETLEEAGLTWEWVNAEALEAARWQVDGGPASADGDAGGVRGIEIGAGRYGAILFASAPWGPRAPGEAVARLAEAGAPVFFSGGPPSRQPGFFDRETGDAKVREAVARIAGAAGVAPAEVSVAQSPPVQPSSASPSLGQPAPTTKRSRPSPPQARPSTREAESGPSPLIERLRRRLSTTTLVERRSSSPAIRHLARSLGDDRARGAVVLVRNASAAPAVTELRLPRSPRGPFLFLDAVSGAIRPAEPGAEGWIRIELAPRDSIFVVAGLALTPTPVEDWPAEWRLPRDPGSGASAGDDQAVLAGEASEANQALLRSWDLTVEGPDVEGGRVEILATPLFDWRDEPRLRLVSSPGHYRTGFELPELTAGQRYLLDLGRVLHAADVTVNGEPATTLLFSPFVVDVTRALRPGPNTIEVIVRSPLLNRFIGMGERGDSRYRGFAGRPPLATGLLGPVRVRRVPADWADPTVRRLGRAP